MNEHQREAFEQVHALGTDGGSRVVLSRAWNPVIHGPIGPVLDSLLEAKEIEEIDHGRLRSLHNTRFQPPRWATCADCGEEFPYCGAGRVALRCAVHRKQRATTNGVPREIVQPAPIELHVRVHMHPLIGELMKQIPASGEPWPDRDRWLAAFNSIIHLVYPGAEA